MRRFGIVGDGFAHEDEFFRRCRMHRASNIPLRLGEPRLHRDRGKLNQFRRFGTGDVHADDTVALGVHNQLHKRALLVAGDDVLHRPEGSPEDPYFAAFPRRLLGEPDRADRRPRKHGRSDVGMIERHRPAIELGFDERHGLADRHGREVDAVRDIANGEDG